MHKNITISDLNIEIQGEGNGFKKHLVAKCGIAIVEFLLSSVLYCYGIIFSEYVFLGQHKYGEGIWTAILFICSWSISDPFSRFISEYFEDRKKIFFRYIIGSSTAFLFIGVMVPRSITLYMISGGILSNVISNQIRAFALDKLDMDYKIFEANRQVVRALSLFIMPHCVFFLVSNYDINQVKLIFASILLNIIPAAFLIRTDDNWNQTPPEMTRYQTIGRFSYQLNEMKSFSKEKDDKADSDSSSSDELPIFETEPEFLAIQDSQSSSQTYSNQNHNNQTSQNKSSEISGDHSVTDLAVPTAFLNPVNVQSYYHNVGVSILPGIPEENEEEVEDINFINSKRLSKISVKLVELESLDQIRKDNIKEVFSINEVINVDKPEPIDKIEYIPDFKGEKSGRTSFIDELKSFNKAKHCFQCSPYRKYIWTRRLRMVKDFVHDNFLRPLYHALKNLYFYPSLTTKVITNLASTLYITLAPFIAMQNSWKNRLIFSTENATFLLTYVAFAWCFFLVSLPIILKLNHGRIRVVFGIGLLVSGTSLWLLSGKLTNDVITISSLLFGFGYGIVTYTEKIVFKSSIGMRPWYLVRGSLEVLSAILVLFIYYLIYLHRLDLKFLLLLAALSYYFNALMWFCLPFVKCSTNFVKRLMFDERSQQEGFFH